MLRSKIETLRDFIFVLYRLCQIAGFPFIVLYFLWRGLRQPRYFARLGERLGILPHSFRKTGAGTFWLHAVSVGEVMSAITLIRRLLEQIPRAHVYVSVTTLAGRAMADEKLAGLAAGVFYAPIDYCFAVRRVLRVLRPAVVVVLETEIWPNLYREAKRFGCGLAVVNGRISSRAFPRYLAWRWFFAPVLRIPDAILAQSEQDRQRYLALGAPWNNVSLAGNLKYDFDPGEAAAPEAVRALLGRLGPEQVWIAASTMPGADAGDVDEDDAVVGAFQELASRHPRQLLILVPRRPERFDSAAEKLARAGVAFVRRSRIGVDPDPGLPGVLLVDTVGELSSLFPLAAVVFMGGSLARRGGHNILEPAFFSRAVIAGPHMENFQAIADEFTAGEGLERIAAPPDLAGAVGTLLDDPERRAATGRRARELAEAKRGATARAVGAIRVLRDESVYRHRRPALVILALAPLAMLWRLGARRAKARRRLSTPVVSVGNLAMGGAGKTPLVLWLARELKNTGRSAAILTRGYRRRSTEKLVVLGPGEDAPAAVTGDEAQILLRRGVAALGIGADRCAAGRLIEERFHPDVILLDDGFQHRRLARDLDIVLLDSLDPFAGGSVFPLGRLREPLSALSRAGAIVVTRAEAGRKYGGLVREIRRHNPAAPVFFARVRPLAWVECGSEKHLPAGEFASKPVAAFCGLANPESFWQTLEELGVENRFSWSFGDHHVYRPRELRRILAQARHAGAEAIVTTEKDMMNLPGDAASLLAPLPLYWLKIDLAVDEGESLLRKAGFERE